MRNLGYTINHKAVQRMPTANARTEVIRSIGLAGHARKKAAGVLSVAASITKI